MTRLGIDEGAKMRRLREALANPLRAYKRIALILEAYSRAAFLEEAWDGEPWERRGVPNIYGVLEDFDLGMSEPEPHRFEPGPVGVNTGLLSNSPAGRATSQFAEVGSNVEYAGDFHNDSTAVSVPVSPEIQELLSAFLRGPGAQWANDLAWLLAPSQTDNPVIGETVGRPFLGLTDDIQADIAEEVGVAVFEVRRG